MLLAALLLAAAPAATVRMQESGSAKVGSAAPSFGGWDLTGQRALTLDGLRRTPYLLPLLMTFGGSWCKPFAAKTGIAGVPAVLDKLELVAKSYGVAGEQKTQLPRTFLIDAGGKVRVIYGAEGDDFEKALEADVEKVAPRPASEGK